MPSRFSSIMSSARRYSLPALGFVLMLVGAVPAKADVCVWRDPERTMQKLFPSARDYKTITVKMTPERIAGIEKALGEKLDESETNEFNFYDIIGRVDGRQETLGVVIALAGKAEYGVIEVVVGVDGKGKIVGTYIQRSRERATKALRSPAFLSQFAGKTKDDGFTVGKDIGSASEGDAASRVVAFVVKKMLVFYDVLMKGGSK